MTITKSVPPEYWGKEQSLIKHSILKTYLQPAARIIGTWCPTFTYVDCCSGPWKLATEHYSDSSFDTAIKQLRAAREYLHGQGYKTEMRCLFVEEDAEAFGQLRQFCNTITDMEVKPLQGDFTKEVGTILRFIDERRNPFTFFFIDPTGWKPLVFNRLAPLLSRRSSEVLINFMTSHIKRFMESEGIGANIGPDYMRKVAGLTGQELDDAAPLSFADELRSRKFYRYTCTSVVLHPTDKKTHYHLIYGTRHPKGVEKFKEAEKHCFPLMQEARLDARRREAGADEQFNLNDDWLPDEDQYVLRLKRHFIAEAFAAVQTARRTGRLLTEEDVWEIASRYPLVWRSDVKEWNRKEKPPASCTSAWPVSHGSKAMRLSA